MTRRTLFVRSILGLALLLGMTSITAADPAARGGRPPIPSFPATVQYVSGNEVGVLCSEGNWPVIPAAVRINGRPASPAALPPNARVTVFWQGQYADRGLSPDRHGQKPPLAADSIIYPAVH
jgi:hypothetical protein